MSCFKIKFYKTCSQTYYRVNISAWCSSKAWHPTYGQAFLEYGVKLRSTGINNSFRRSKITVSNDYLIYLFKDILKIAFSFTLFYPQLYKSITKQENKDIFY